MAYLCRYTLWQIIDLMIRCDGIMAKKSCTSEICMSYDYKKMLGIEQYNYKAVVEV